MSRHHAAVDGSKDFILFLYIYADALKCFSDTTIRTDECFPIVPAECRSALIRQSTLGADAL